MSDHRNTKGRVWEALTGGRANQFHTHDTARPPAGRIDTDSHQAEPPQTKSTSAVSRRYSLDSPEVEALVVHCADPRFQTAFREFVTDELGIHNYVPIVIGGGVHAFGVQSLLPKNFKVLWEQIKFAVTQRNVRQIIIINHEDCLWYERMKGYHPSIQSILKSKSDLKTAADIILHDFSGIHVRMFWAAIESGQVYFTEIAPTS